MIDIVLQGFGAMGRAAATALSGRCDARVIAVLEVQPDLVGARVGDLVSGTPWPELVVQHADTVDLGGLGGDVVVHTTTAFAAVAVPQIARLLAAGYDVATLCQELVYPRAENLDAAADLDRIAREHGKSVVAGGVNPGWILDVVPVAASLGCVDVRGVRATRVVDFSPYGPDEMVHIGAGLDVAAFREGAASGEIGHIGLLESAALVADGLGLEVDDWEQTKEPVVAARRHVTPFVAVEPGGARGFRQRVVGRRDTGEGPGVLVEMEMIGLLDVGEGDPALGDRIEISATPSMSLTIHGDDTSEGGLATAGVVTNLIGPVHAAAPGLHTVLTLPLARSRQVLELASSTP